VALFRATTVQCFSKIDVMHMFMKTQCICSRSVVLMMHVSMTRLPTKWVSDWEDNHRLRRRCAWRVAILTTKIPSALLVAIMWLQRTWRPRFYHSTFSYVINVTNTREASMSREVPMRMHVSSPKVPKCTCYAIACSRRDMVIYIFTFQNAVSKTMRHELMIKSSK
jgi:hypothetical protein